MKLTEKILIGDDVQLIKYSKLKVYDLFFFQGQLGYKCTYNLFCTHNSYLKSIEQDSVVLAGSQKQLITMAQFIFFVNKILNFLSFTPKQSPYETYEEYKNRNKRLFNQQKYVSSKMRAEQYCSEDDYSEMYGFEEDEAIYYHENNN